MMENKDNFDLPLYGSEVARKRWFLSKTFISIVVGVLVAISLLIWVNYKTSVSNTSDVPVLGAANDSGSGDFNNKTQVTDNNIQAVPLPSLQDSNTYNVASSPESSKQSNDSDFQAKKQQAVQQLESKSDVPPETKTPPVEKNVSHPAPIPAAVTPVKKVVPAPAPALPKVSAVRVATKPTLSPQNTAPSTGMSESADKVTKVQVILDGPYVIQFASFTARPMADSLKKSIEKKAPDIIGSDKMEMSVTTYDHNNANHTVTTYYRVRGLAFKSRSDAQVVCNYLKRADHVSNCLVMRR